ncbi:MAG: TonB-dependent siderophore receptor [Rivularia sp. (in: cyanobacteria)]
MKILLSASNVNVGLIIILSGCLSALGIQAARAEEASKLVKKQSKILQLSEVKFPSTSARMLVQTPTNSSPNQEEQQNQIVSITGVTANPKDKGLEVVLQTTQARQLKVINRSSDNNFIADIPNAQLKLASGDTFKFSSEKPLDGITQITVTNLDENTVRITATGETALPKVELFDSGQGLIFGLAPVTSTAQKPQTKPEETQKPEGEKPTSETPSKKPAQQDETIELIVTGERDGYSVPNATTATRTDTPLRDIPQSIQVVPRQVIEDRNPRNLTEAVETVSGVVDGGNNFGSPSGARIIRGFSQGFSDAGVGNYRNGFRDSGYFSLTGVGTIEQVEVLKGPGSVLFGSVEPGGIINVITKQPLSEPYYKIGFEAGNYEFYQPSIDFSGPLNADKTVLYRFIASYQNKDGFQDFVNTDLTTIAPSISLKLGDKTDLNLYYEYINFTGDPPEQYGGIFSDGSFLPENFFLGYPQFNFIDITTQKFGYTLTHELNDNLQIRNNFAVNLSDTEDKRAVGNELVDNQFLTDFYTADQEYTKNNYFGQIDLLSKFKTGTISHQLLVGFDFNRFDGTQKGTEGGSLPDLDLFNPNYDVSAPVNTSSFDLDDKIQSYGFYVQDQIAVLDKLKLLIGGRLDWIEQSNEFIFDNEDLSNPDQNDTAFSPRIGLVYQPSDSVSLYASYSQSFFPTSGFNPDGRAFEPTRGTQYEAGVKTDFLGGKLSATLAAYEITKSNVTTTDPDNPEFSIQVGEQRSRGIELDVAGEILPGLKVTASYAYTDAEITEDNSFSVGNKLVGVPEHQASLWTTYEIQKGNLKGLGFGLGLFYVGMRQGDLDNSFEIPDYLRTDAAVYFRRDGFNTAINIRNLFDTEYFRSSDGGRIFLQRGAPFTIVGSVGWEL